MKQYFEAHVTMLGSPSHIEPIVSEIGWKFSAIDGDANLGPGIKCYATRQINIRAGEDGAIAALMEAAQKLSAAGATVLRRKVEIVIFDDRSKAEKQVCNGACLECVS